MNWIKVNSADLYRETVLGICFKEGFGYKEMIIGYFHLEDDGIPAIETEYELLKPVTHYIPESELLELKQLVK